MFIYPRWTIDACDALSYWPLVLVVVIAGVLALMYARGSRGPALTVAFYAGTIFPALGFFNIYPMLFSFVADHFQYLASLGMIALMAASLHLFARAERMRLALMCTILAVLWVCTFRHAAAYRDSETLWRDTLSKNDEAFLPHTNLGMLLLTKASVAQSQGDRAAHNKFAQEQLKPDYAPGLMVMSGALRLQNRLDEALQFAQRSLQRTIEDVRTIRPNEQTNIHLAIAHWRVARLHAALKQYDKALASFHDGLRLVPEDSPILSDVARFLMEDGNSAAANQNWHAADQLYRAALNSTRDNADVIAIANTLARFLASCPEPAIRNPAQAVQLAEQAARRTNRADPLILDTLALAYEANGRIDDGIQTAVEAAALARRLGRVDLAASLESRAAALGQSNAQ